jgi:CubicO group peptidase (beta-lactamase class C family)
VRPADIRTPRCAWGIVDVVRLRAILPAFARGWHRTGVMAPRRVRQSARAGLWCLAVVVALLLLSIGWIARGSAMPAVFPGTHWEESPPESRGLDPVRLQAAIEFLKTNAPGDGVDELVIVQHGVLVWRGPAADRVHGTWSCTKSFVSTVLGLLVDDGKAHLDAKVATVLPSLAATYPDVTFRHLTTMTSGYRAEGDTPIGSYSWGPSPTPFVPSATPLFTPPGSKYAYWDSAMNQLAHALTRIAGEPIAGLFKRRIADPIGMDAMRWYWPAFDTQDGLVVNGGAGNHEADVHISARDLARLGLLYANRGRITGATWAEFLRRLGAALVTREVAPRE